MENIIEKNGKKYLLEDGKEKEIIKENFKVTMDGTISVKE